MQKIKNISPPTEILKAALIAAVLFFALAAVASAVFLKLNIPSGSYFSVLMLCLGAAGITGGFVAVKKKKQKGILLGALSGIIAIIPITVAMWIAQGSFSKNMLLPILMFIVCSGAGGFIAINSKGKRVNKIKKKK